MSPPPKHLPVSSLDPALCLSAEVLVRLSALTKQRAGSSLSTHVRRERGAWLRGAMCVKGRTQPSSGAYLHDFPHGIRLAKGAFRKKKAWTAPRWLKYTYIKSMHKTGK